jgi:hypothetical protein
VSVGRERGAPGDRSQEVLKRFNGTEEVLRALVAHQAAAGCGSHMHECTTPVHQRGACMHVAAGSVQVEPVACEGGERNQRTPSAPPQGHSQLPTCTHHC